MSAGEYLAPGSRFAERYEIGRELGRGGVSVVYAAHDRQVNQDVALKLIVPSPASAQHARERMRREVHAVRRLVHANIVAVYDFVEDGPYGAVIMELADGEDLDRRVRRAGALPADTVAAIGVDIAAALTEAHRHGILHRDVKPQNILIERTGRARLTDFGSARMDGDATITRTGALVGTVAYLAPEVVAGRRGDARADVFALGITLLYASAGRLPDRPSPHLPLPPADSGYTPLAVGADVPTWLAHAIARATAADPADRYPTPAALGNALARRDAGAGELTVGPARDRCVLCGAPDVLGLAVCPGCTNGTRGEKAGRLLVILDTPRRGTERDQVIERLAALLGPDTDPATLVAVATGQRALMAVPEGTDTTVVQLLAARGLRARAISRRALWRALPSPFMAMVSAVVVFGFVAGAVADRALLALVGPFTALLVVGGVLSLRRPAVHTDARPSPLSSHTRARVIESMAALPPGSARSLLADVVRRGQSVRRGLAMRRDGTGLDGRLEELIDVACASALDLGALDESLAQFEAERGRVDPADSRWLDSYTECERTRDAAVQQLLDAVTVLAQLDVQAARGVTGGGDELGVLVAEMAGEVRARRAARDDLAALLAR